MGEELAIRHPSLERLEKAKALLAETASVDDAKQLRDMAEAARVYAREARLGLETQNYAAEIKIRAERRAGELLKEMEKHPGGRPVKPVVRDDRFPVPRLGDLGITKDQSSRWQQLVDVPEETIEEVAQEFTEQGRELTTTGLLEVVKRPERALYSSESEEWYTPPDVLGRVRLLGEIDLDPCSNGGSPIVPARRHFTKEDDGLVREWAGFVYMNPPYGRGIDEWIPWLPWLTSFET